MKEISHVIGNKPNELLRVLRRVKRLKYRTFDNDHFMGYGNHPRLQVPYSSIRQNQVPIQIRPSRSIPEIGSIWQHMHYDTLYRVQGVCINKSNQDETMVLYKALNKNDLYVRTVENFNERFIEKTKN